MAQFLWKITDPTLVNKMKSAATGESFRSSVFTMHKFRWYLQCHPNGNTDKSKSSVKIFVYIAALLSKVKSVRTKYKIIFVEGDATFETIQTFDSDNMNWGLPSSKLKTSDIQKYKTLTFKFSQ